MLNKENNKAALISSELSVPQIQKRIPVLLNKERNSTWIICKQKQAEQEAALISSKLTVPQPASKRQMLDPKMAQKFEDKQFPTIGKWFEEI